MNDRAAQRERAAQQVFRLRHQPTCQRLAHACRGDGRAVLRQQLDRLHLEAEVEPEFGEALRGALAVASEGEVAPDDDQLQPCLLDEDAREVLGGDLRELGGELHDRDEVDARGAELFDARFEGGEVGDLDVGAEHGDRVRVEGDDAGAELAGGGLGAQPLDQHPVAAVNPVEDAERQRVRARGGGAAQLFANEQHVVGLSPLSRCRDREQGS